MARLTHNPNGTNYCEDCKLIVILFDDDTHECHTEEWMHDEDRAGGCTWCGSWAQVNSESLCRDCW